MSDGSDATRGRPAAQIDVQKLAVVTSDVAARIKSAAAQAAMPMAMQLAPAAVAAKPAKPGKERWPVKTGADPDSQRVGRNDFSGVDSSGIVETTVEELTNFPRPDDMSDIRGFQNDYQDRRAEPVEFVIWRLKADITVVKKEADGDLHLVLQGDSGRTMVAEAPTPAPPFVVETSPWFDAMKDVRRQLAEHFGPAFAGVTFRPLDAKFLMPAGPLQPTVPLAVALAVPVEVPPGVVDAFEALQPFESKVPRTPVTITGVGFFDRVHDQTGVAFKNGIELHPILAIEFD